MKNSLLVFFVVAFCFFACRRPTSYLNDSSWAEYSEPLLSNVSVYDTLPKKVFQYTSVHQLNGIKAAYATGKSTTYFEYEGDAATFLFAISTLPFKQTEVADALCRKVNSTFSLSGKKMLSDDEIKAASFFWEIDPAQYTFYECVKGRQRHTILINTTTGRILHRIEA